MPTTHRAPPHCQRPFPQAFTPLFLPLYSKMEAHTQTNNLAGGGTVVCQPCTLPPGQQNTEQERDSKPHQAVNFPIAPPLQQHQC